MNKNIYETYVNIKDSDNANELVDCAHNYQLCKGGYMDHLATKLNLKTLWKKIFPDDKPLHEKKNDLDRKKVNIWLDEVKPVVNNERCIQTNKFELGKMNLTKYLFITFIVILIWMYVLASFIAGFHAWNEHPDDLITHKIIKTYFAVIASPLYLLYIFLRIMFFK